MSGRAFRTLSARSTLLLAPAALAGCASPYLNSVTIHPERVGACLADTPCELAGQFVLQLEPGSYNMATIDQVHGTCVPVLVPERLFASYRRWQGKQARVRGIALARVRVDDDMGRVKYRDRWLIEGICGNSDIVLYADEAALER